MSCAINAEASCPSSPRCGGCRASDDYVPNVTVRMYAERLARESREREERRILDAARAWARAERALRDSHGKTLSWDEQHRIGVTADYTEQMLLDACEGVRS